MPLFPLMMVSLAGLLTTGLAVAVFAMPPPSSGMDGLGATLLIAAAMALRWVLLALALSHCVVAGGFVWLRAQGWRWVAVMLGHAALGGLSAMSMFAFLEAHSMSGLPGWLGGTMHLVAQLGCTVPAVMVLVFLCVVTRPAPVLAGSAAGAMAGVGAGALAGVLVVAAMLAQDEMYARGRVEADRLAAETHDGATRERFAMLTDADPLLKWDEFVGANVPADVSTEALRRLSVRPGLERDLEAAMTCDCHNPLWSKELLWLFVNIPYTPTAGMAGPVGQAMAALTANLGDSARAAREDERDIYVDRYLNRDLEVVPGAALKLARAAKVDLRPAVLEMRRAVLEHYPRSEAASRFPGEADRAIAEIGGALGR